MGPWARLRWIVVGTAVSPRTGSIITAIVLAGIAGLLYWMY